MTLGEIFKEAAKRDLSAREKKGIEYSEIIENGRHQIRLSCEAFKEAWIETDVEEGYLEANQNYNYLYFLSMVFNAAIYGMKRMKEVKRKDIPLPLRKVENYCIRYQITPEELTAFHERFKDHPALNNL